MSYLLDANVFIEAKNRHYGFDFCPAFWEWLVEQNASKRVFSIDKMTDYYLVAHAMAGKFVVVTHEARDNSTRRIKIPNVCAGLGLRCMNPYEMLRRENARFVLEGSA